VVNRSGRSSLGCLFSLLIFAAVIYFGINFAEVYWRYFEFRDAMRQEVRFARQITDDRIQGRLAALADSLGLPEEAGQVEVTRTTNTISVRTQYLERVELPMFTRSIRLTPHAEGTF
jgi:hypothetical protein